MANTGRHIVLRKRPEGVPEESDFALEETPIPVPDEGQVLVRNIYMSVDPYMRRRMRAGQSHFDAFELGSPLSGSAVGEVVASRNPDIHEGALVSNFFGWREYFVSDGKGLDAVDPALARLSAYLGVLGMPGFTGWYGLTEIGQPKAGETLVVSAAAGAVGSLVGQVGRIRGCRVVGTAGSDEKCRYLEEELGYDAAINYKSADDLHGALRDACPDGIDIYFENVGGRMLEAVLELANPHARIPVCGMISQYNLDPPDPGPRNLFALIANGITMKGFLIRDHEERYADFIREVAPWIAEGKLKYTETIVEGIENAPRAFINLFHGANIGKMLVRLAPDLTRAASE